LRHGPAARRLAAVGIGIVVVAGALGAPATVASGASAGSGRDRCPAGARPAIVQAYANVFSRAQGLPLAERAASLDRSGEAAVAALLERSVTDPAGANVTVSVVRVRCPRPDRAVVDADLVLAGVPLAEVLPEGRAVRRAGTWKVATATFCDRMTLEDPGLAGRCP
jgi:hypothetical protein